MSGIGNDHVDTVAGVNPDLGGGRSTAQKVAAYFNPAAFTENALGTFGNVGRNTMRAPGFAGLDFALTKSFSLGKGLISESHRLDFRAEAFNLFNHPNLGRPEDTQGSTFGQILSAGDPRIVQLSLKYVF